MPKKIAAFCGREHHYKRLVGIKNALTASGCETVWISGDNAVNIDPHISILIQNNEPFKHVLDYLGPNSMAVVNNIVADGMSHLNNDAEFDADLFSFVDSFWIAYSVREFSEFQVSFNLFLEKEKPDAVLFLHENNAWGRAIAYSCMEKGIPSVCFQEGMLRQRDQDTQNKQGIAADYSSILFVWSESARHEYIRAGVVDTKICVSGMAHLDNYLGRDEKHKPRYKSVLGYSPNLPLVTFALPQMSRYDGDPLAAIGMLADYSSNNAVNMVVRPHPFESPITIANLQKQLDKHPSMKVITTGETPDLILASDLVLSQHSTVAVEALALGVSLAEIDLSGIGILESKVEAGVVFGIGKGELEKIKQILSGELKLNPATLAQWKQINLGPLDGHSTDRVVERLMAL